jgi:hypothetical protein
MTSKPPGDDVGNKDNASDEPVTSSGVERRNTTQERVVEGSRTRATGSVGAGTMGEPTTARSVGVASRLSLMIAELTEREEQEASNCPAAKRLTTHPAVGSPDGFGAVRDGLS